MEFGRSASRRDFLAQGVGGFALLVSGPVACGESRVDSGLAALRAHQVGGLEAVGRHYLATRSDAPTSDILLAELPPSLRRAWIEGGGSRALPEIDLGEVVRADFAAGRLQSLRGWWMSQAELRICALVALGDGRS